MQIHHRPKLRLKLKITKTYTLHLCCALSDSIKSLKAISLKIFSVSQARSSLEISSQTFAAAYSNVDWPIAVFYLGR